MGERVDDSTVLRWELLELLLGPPTLDVLTHQLLCRALAGDDHAAALLPHLDGDVGRRFRATFADRDLESERVATLDVVDHIAPRLRVLTPREAATVARFARSLTGVQDPFYARVGALLLEVLDDTVVESSRSAADTEGRLGA
jgi:hypothetical protein